MLRRSPLVGWFALAALACSSEAPSSQGAGAGSAGTAGGSALPHGGSAGVAGGGASGASGLAGGVSAGSGGANGGTSGASNGGASGAGAVAGSSEPGGAGGEAGSDAVDGCPATGAISYTLAKADAPTAEQQAAYDAITEAMDTALSYYNCYTDIEKVLNVSYVPSVPTADGNVNGSIRFGQMPYMNHITAMHEISHTVGIGNDAFDALIVDGVFTGENATAQLRAITGDSGAVVHGDVQHFWPYGLNQTSEVMSEQDLIDHCLMVVAIRKDIGE